MINLINYSNKFNNKQIQELVNLLPPEYQNLNIDVIFPKNKLQCLKWINQKHYISLIPNIFLGKIEGSSCQYYNKCFIYLFNFDITNYSIEKMYAIKTIFHEIRHQYQRLYISDKYNDKKLNKTKYKYKWTEQDAETFSNNIMNKYSDKIIDIVGM
jgi:hypothetical protein